MMVMKSEREYLQKLQAHAADALRYLSDKCRPERERAVCRAFLRCVGVSFVEVEIVAPASEPADVLFRDAMFQVRELLEQGSRRGDEWKLRLVRAVQARSMDDVTVPWGPLTPMSFSELTMAITEALKRKSRRYGKKQCSDLDALVYMDLTWTSFLRPDTARGDTSGLEAQGWRSVSIVFPPYGIVLYAAGNAPSFLRQLVGTVRREWVDLHELFDVEPSIY